jgi:hypothetical protein
VAAKLDEYLAVLRKWGLRDYQVSTLDEPNPTHHYHTFAHALMVMLLASIPTLFLNLPVGVLVGIIARREAKEDLKKSRVKLHARDVLLSKKMLYSIVAVPALWLTWGVFLFLIMGFSFKATVMFLFCCPFFSYLGVKYAEEGMMDIKDFRPVYNRLFSQFREDVVKHLPQQRLALQAEVRSLVKKYGPDLDALYFPEDVQWDQIIRHHLRDEEPSTSITGDPEDNLKSGVKKETDNESGVDVVKDEEEDEAYEQRVSNMPAPGEPRRRLTSTDDESPFSLLPDFSISLGLQNTESSNDFIQEYIRQDGGTTSVGNKSRTDLAALSLTMQEESAADIEEEGEEVTQGNEDEEELDLNGTDSDPYVQIDASCDLQPDESKKDQ